MLADFAPAPIGCGASSGASFVVLVLFGWLAGIAAAA